MPWLGGSEEREKGTWRTNMATLAPTLVQNVLALFGLPEVRNPP
jgi:hypothetical protein